MFKNLALIADMGGLHMLGADWSSICEIICWVVCYQGCRMAGLSLAVGTEWIQLTRSLALVVWKVANGYC